MARYYSMCELGDGSPSTGCSASTVAGTFDTTRQRGSVANTTSTSYLESGPFLDATSTTQIYVTGRVKTHGAVTASNGSRVFSMVNSSGVTVIQWLLANSGTTFNLQYWNGTSYVTAVNLPWPTADFFKVDVHLICGASGSMEIYFDGVIQGTGAYSIPSAAVDNIAKVRYGGSSNTLYWTEMAGADFDLRDLTIRYDPPTGDSAVNTAWTGSYLDVDEAVPNDADMIVSSAAGQREGFTKAAYTIGSNQQIDSYWVSGRMRVSGVGPTGIKPSLRIGGTNYDGDAMVIPSVFGPAQEYYDLDPSTGSSWTSSSYNALELGVVST